MFFLATVFAPKYNSIVVIADMAIFNCDFAESMMLPDLF
jgi:hypothetical protein